MGRDTRRIPATELRTGDVVVRDGRRSAVLVVDERDGAVRGHTGRGDDVVVPVNSSVEVER